MADIIHSETWAGSAGAQSPLLHQIQEIPYVQTPPFQPPAP